MDPKRQGEIALMVLKYLLRKQGIELSRNKMRETSGLAKAIGISVEELKQFVQPLVEEFMRELFAMKQSEN
jgi:hypothetical protein